MAYKVVRLTGDYEAREAEARRRGCAMVWHQHLNSVGDPRPSYALVEIAEPTTQRELRCARDAAANYAKLLGGGLGAGDGVKVLKDGERGENIIDNTLEAYISEPLFASNPAQARWVAVPANQRALARAAVDAIKANYPDGSTIGLSIGHIGKTSSPRDRGAVVVGTGLTEAAVCTGIIAEMERLLKSKEDTMPKEDTMYWLIIALFGTAADAGAFRDWCATQGIAALTSGVAVIAHGNDDKSRKAEAEAERRGGVCPWGRVLTTQDSYKHFSRRTPYTSAVGEPLEECKELADYEARFGRIAALLTQAQSEIPA